jgi:RHS repeat-associated protein
MQILFPLPAPCQVKLQRSSVSNTSVMETTIGNANKVPRLEGLVAMPMSAKETSTSSFRCYQSGKRQLLCLLILGFAGNFEARLNAVDSVVSAQSTLYINKYFEVRDYDTPTKYVWNGETRVARVTGSISTRPRMQLLRVNAGWNLRTLAVAAANAGEQLWQTQNNRVTGVFKWSASTSSFLELSSTDGLTERTVLWLRATANTTLAVIGEPRTPPFSQTVTGSDFIASSGSEPYVPTIPISSPVAVWMPPEGPHGWSIRYPSYLAIEPCPLPLVGPNNAFFVRSESPIEIHSRDTNLSLRYYHTDHLRSATLISDNKGQLAEGTTYYPFGARREHEILHEIEEAYQFSQKEPDSESGLSYFGKRYMNGGLARFLSPDILCSMAPVGLLGNPQDLNSFAYCSSSPMRFVDPTGCKKQDALESSGLIGVTRSGSASETPVTAGGDVSVSMLAYELNAGIGTSGIGAQGEISLLRLDMKLRPSTTLTVDTGYATAQLMLGKQKSGGWGFGAELQGCYKRAELEYRLPLGMADWGFSAGGSVSACLGAGIGFTLGSKTRAKLGPFGIDLNLKLDLDKTATKIGENNYESNYPLTGRNRTTRLGASERGFQIRGGVTEFSGGVGFEDAGHSQSSFLTHDEMRSESK